MIGTLHLNPNFLFLVSEFIINNNYYSHNNLNCAASQMWLFATILPILIGDKVSYGDGHWECFLLLLEITKYCTATVIAESSAEYLSTLIERHHHLFKLCYPGKPITPKMHFLIHFPRLVTK